MPAPPQQNSDNVSSRRADDRQLFIGRRSPKASHRRLVEATCPRLGGSCFELLEAQRIVQRADQIGVEAIRIAKFACMVNGPDAPRRRRGPAGR